MFREKDVSSLAGFHVGSLSCLNWNLGCWFLWREENREPRERPSTHGENQQKTQSTYSTRREFN